MSPSANHLLALINCQTLMTCFKAIIGALILRITHGTNESILFARASSNAAALWGLAKMNFGGGLAGDPGWRVVLVPLPETCSREGDRYGEEKERRYSAMKKTSLRQQQTKRTV
jgi:hypothetical protein